ncbi:type VI secretion system secreted protein VgrG [Pseudomonas sp. ok272]|uniref:type VI secretion system Vgr family protein n=1 Tax=unclassified Pseudomonas TaxID=196821 RepID=UPI0008C03B77|nr:MULTISPECIES: type VI secretion system tip protein VgrG [unclassified Pseudomonas]SEN67516.1 type VI secretion system secreted protein VgrG [Pseudomonas sp. ok272]SFN46924.1 type VI secretion system secreted protein VgrG [Pseudomonas sp. ok602]
MHRAADLTPFLFTVEGFTHDLQVLEFSGKEAINQPFEFRITLVSERPDLDLDNLLHRPAFLRLGAEGSGIHGAIYSAAQGESNARLTHYQVTLVPRLAYLAHRHNKRIFQHLSVPEIIAKVLADHAILADTWRFQLRTPYEPREYCVQYAETDLHFIQRLCEEEGLHFHFQHSTDGHFLVFGEDQAAFAPLTPATAYLPGSGQVAYAPTVDRFNVRLEARTTQVSRADYDFQHPNLRLNASADAPQTPALEDYAFPAHFTDRRRGRQLATRALERHRSDHKQAHGRSDQPILRSGHSFTLADHPRQEWNDAWLLTHVEHVGKQPQVLEEHAPSPTSGDDFSQGYRNHFIAIPEHVSFRPPLDHPKKPALGTESAVVTGPPGEEIHSDAFGRVKVRLPWDRDDTSDEHSSCWLRVVTGWAHQQYGSVLIPRVGMEVLVGFSEGDPDKPVVLGCLPNAETPVPLDLPAQQTRSIFRSHSTPGGDGYNELCIEDRKGLEEITLRAQRDFTQLVRNDQHLEVGGQRNTQVKGLSSHELHAEEHRITHGSRLTELRQDDHLVVAGSQQVLTNNQQLTATGEIQLSAGQQIVLDGGTQLTVQAGGHWLSLGPGGIFSSVRIVEGGSAAAVSSTSPLLPGELPAMASTFEPLQQRAALLASRSSRCLICEAARP